MDIYNTVWDPVDASNTAAAPDGAIEGMMPSGVNDVLRAHQGAIKRYVHQQMPVTTTGTSTAFLVSYSVPPDALYGGATFLVLFHAANGAGATLNIGGLGAKPLYYYAAGAWRAAPAGLIGVNQIFRVTYNAAAGAYRVLRARDDTGEVVAFAGATAPAGSLLCYGQAISRTAYAGLFAALSTAHGVGDGSTTFNLPDLRGRVAAGKGNMGGTESGRLNTYVASTLGAAGGAQSHALALTELPSHSHSGTGGFSFAMANSGTAFGYTQPTVTSTFIGYTATTGPAGSSSAHTNVQPTMALNYVIRI
jgi:microcystin-dependent protein